MTRNCLKCGHSNPMATGGELEPCPKCGAIYSRVEAAMTEQLRSTEARTPKPRVANFEDSIPQKVFRRSRFAVEGGFAPADAGVRSLVEHIRQHTVYPNYRFWRLFLYIFGMVFAALVLVAAIILIFDGKFLVGLGTALVSVLVFAVAKLWEEASSMVVDFVDATLVIAIKKTASMGPRSQ